MLDPLKRRNGRLLSREDDNTVACDNSQTTMPHPACNGQVWEEMEGALARARGAANR